MPQSRKRAVTDTVDLPSTLQRSGSKAQRTFRKTLLAARESYPGDEARARRTAFAALKHSFEKVGNRWVAKERRGPSDPRATSGGADPDGATAGGVDVVGHRRDELLARARRLGIKGRSRMTKLQLGQAIARRQG